MRRVAVVAVVADTHIPRGARVLPPTCAERIRAAELVLHAGDFTSTAFVAELAELGPPLRGVHGNMDEPALRASLPAERVVEVGGARIGLVHDAGPRAGREARLAARFPGCDAVVYGHSHLPQVERLGALWVLNPGSPTERRRAPFRSMIVLSIFAGRLEPELVRLESM